MAIFVNNTGGRKYEKQELLNLLNAEDFNPTESDNIPQKDYTPGEHIVNKSIDLSNYSLLVVYTHSTPSAQFQYYRVFYTEDLIAGNTYRVVAHGLRRGGSWVDQYIIIEYHNGTLSIMADTTNEYNVSLYHDGNTGTKLGSYSQIYLI